MRLLVVLALIVLFVGALVVTNGLGVFDPPMVAPGGDQPAHPAKAAPQPVAAGLPAGTVATRTIVANTTAKDLADAESACILVLDHTTSRPVSAAAVRRLQTGDDLAFTDARGLAPLPLRSGEQLAVVLDGYLLRLVPARLGTSEAQPQEVRLVRDDWSPRQELRFVTAAGNRIEEAFVRLRPKQPQAATKSPVPSTDAVLQRAWMEHTMLAGRPVCADVAVQLGTYDEERVYRLVDGVVVRFLVAGDYALEAATAAGLVARADLRIAAANATAARVEFVAGGILQGLVTGEGGSAPLPSCKVTLQGGDPLGLEATTAADGTFRLGPLLPGPVTLHVRHPDHEPLAAGPFTVPVTNLRLELRPLPRSTLRGRVRSLPDLQPLADAAVVWLPNGSGAVKATTGADGLFTLHATGTTAARVVIQAPGHVGRSELVDPGSAFADYDLWPADTETRLAKGLTALLEGIVVDAEGRPVAGVPVRWHPAQRREVAGTPGRRVLEGGALELPVVASTDPEGIFRLETTHFGPGRLTVAEGAGKPDVGTTANAGRSTNGLRLQR